MKILCLTSHLEGTDGWSRYSVQLIEALQKLGHEVAVVAMEGSGVSAAVLHRPKQYLFNPAVAALDAPHVNEKLRTFSPDILHILIEPYALLLPHLTLGGARAILTIHGTYAYLPGMLGIRHRLMYARQLKRMYQSLGGVIAVSAFTKAYFLNRLSRSLRQRLEGKTIVIHNSVSEAAFAKHTHTSASTSEVLFVGAIKPRKGVREAIRALGLYWRENKKPFVFRIVGECEAGDHYAKLITDEAQNSGIADKIIFENKVSESRLRELYAGADLFLMLPINHGSIFEGFGIVYLEANAAGTPVIGADDSGSSDAIVDGVTGYTVAPRDSVMVARRVRDVLIEKRIGSADCLAWARAHESVTLAKETVAFYVSASGKK